MLDDGLGAQIALARILHLFIHGKHDLQHRQLHVLRFCRFLSQPHILDEMLDEETRIIIFLQHLDTVVAHLPAAGRTLADGAEQFFRIQACLLYTSEIPLGEIVFDFFDKLKSCTKGYASLDYEISEYKKSDLVKMDILLNGELIDALSIIVHRDFA